MQFPVPPPADVVANPSTCVCGHSMRQHRMWDAGLECVDCRCSDFHHEDE